MIPFIKFSFNIKSLSLTALNQNFKKGVVVNSLKNRPFHIKCACLY